MSPNRRAAAWYAEKLGWPVAPAHWIEPDGRCSCRKPDCQSPGKHPLTPKGFKDATKDLETIGAWWEQYPKANIIVPTGSPSGIWTLDVDPHHGGGDSLADLEAEHDHLPTTLEQITGGDGQHVVFNHPGPDFRNTAGKLGPGLDTRGEGGYIIVAPSNHKSGNLYRWREGYEPGQIEIADAPPWLLDRLKKGKRAPNTPSSTPSRHTNGGASTYVETAFAEEVMATATAQEGTRNDQLNASAFALGQFVGAGLLDHGRVEPALADAARKAGLSQAEIEPTLRSGLEAGAAEPRDVLRYGSEEETKDEVVARLAKLSPIEFDRVKQVEAKALGCTASSLIAEVKAYKKRQPVEEAPLPDVEALAESAAEIIECDDVLGLFDADWNRLIAGEQRVGRLLLLAGTSRLLDKPMNAAIKGSSAGGKSETRKRALKFFPPEDVISFTSLSERALIYTDDDFQHKILSMGEAVGTDDQGLQDYLLRELMSEGLLRYQTAQKVGSEIQTVVIEKHGPVAFLVTTTKRKLHPENETRMLSLDIDDSEEQTRAVLKKIAQNEGSNAAAGHVDFKPWQDFQRWLAAGESRVVVPYAEALANTIPPRSVRLRRDFGQVLQAIKAHALLHRQHRAVDSRGAIIADIDHDYAAVRELMHDLLAESSEVKIKESIIETINVVSELTKGLDDKSGTTAKVVGKRLGLDRSTALRRLRQAEDGGFIVNLEDKRGRPGKYRCTGEQVEAIDMMPTAEALKAVYHDTSYATTQPDNQGGLGSIDQGDRDCKADRNQDCNQSPSDMVANVAAHPHATTETRRELPKTEQRLQGCAVAPEDADDDKYEREERAAIQNEPEPDPYDMPIPAAFDRRKSAIAKSSARKAGER